MPDSTTGAGRFVSNAGLLVALQVVSYALPLVSAPYLTRVLGITSYSVVAFGLTCTYLAAMVTDFGFNLSATLAVTKAATRKRDLRQIYGEVIGAKAIILSLLVVAFAAFVLLNNRYSGQSSYLWWLIASFAGQAFLPVWLFQGLQRMGFIVAYTATARALYLVLLFVLVHSPHDLWLVALANGISWVIGATVGVILTVRVGIAPLSPTWSGVTRQLRESAPYFTARAAIAVYTSAGAVYLGLFGVARELSFYSVAQQFYTAGIAILMPVTQALYPYMAQTRDLRTLFRVLRVGVATAAVGVLIAVFFARPIVRTIFGDAYDNAAPTVIGFSVIFLLVVPSAVLAYPFAAAFGEPRRANTGIYAAAVAEIVLLGVLSAVMTVDAVTVVVTVIAVEAMLLVVRIVVARGLLNAAADSTDRALNA